MNVIEEILFLFLFVFAFSSDLPGRTDPSKSGTPTPPHASTQPVHRDLLLHGTAWATAVYLLDAWVLGFGIFGAFLGSVAALVALARALSAFGQRQRSHAFAHLGMIGIWVFTAALTLGTTRWQASHAKAHAETVIAACNAYKAANGSYPDTLQALVPTYLPAIPRAKYTLVAGTFAYFRRPAPAQTMLMFTIIPPFMRTSYTFETDSWFTVD